MDGKLSRRYLLASFATTGFIASPMLAASSLDTVPLYPDDSHSLYRVRMTLDVDGNAEVPKNAIANDDVRQLGVKAGSIIDFEERLTRDPDGLAQAARRYYYEASTKTQVQSSKKESGLRVEARRGVLQMVDSRSVLYGEHTQLTSDELQLLRVPVNSLAIDRLLPYKSVKKGDSWKIPSDILALLFDMDAVQETSITAKLTSFDDKAAKMEISGEFSAAVDGVPTTMRLRGKSTFDRKQRAITWLALALREDRDIGNAEPGFDLAAQIRIIRQAMPKPNAVKNSAAIDYANPPGNDKLMVEVRSEKGGFSVVCDRSWRVMSTNDRFTSMRMIENDNVIAQCDVRTMPPLKDGHQLTLEAFQSDIQRTIGDRFGEFIEAEEKLTGNGVRLLRVVASGLVEKIPVQWVYLHFSNDDTRRSAAIFTLADKQLERFGGSDVQFAEGFRFVDLPATESSADEVAVDTQSSELGESIVNTDESQSDEPTKVASQAKETSLQLNSVR